MAISADDWAQILKHTRTRVREVGLGDLDEQIALDFRSTESASSDLLRYLDSVISALGERSLSTYQRALDTFREYIQTEEKTSIQGIQVLVQERDFAIFSTHEIELADELDFGAAIAELRRLRHELVSTGLFDEQSSG